MIAKTTERIKKTGEVFTPDRLVKQMLEELGPTAFQNASTTFLDPAAGSGNFLVEIVTRKRAHGATPHEALASTYGVDIMADNVAECRQRVFRAAVQDDDLDYYAEFNPFKRFIKKRALHRMQQLVRNNIRHGDALKFDMEDIFSSTPSEELLNFRNKKDDISELDSGA